MKTYKVCVNGNEYEVTVEEMQPGETARAAAAPATSAAPATPATPATSAAPATSATPVASAATTISAPMPGTILSVNIKVGDTVQAGQVLFILEAMKMENEIMAPAGGTVTAVAATKGASVNSGDMLCTLA